MCLVYIMIEHFIAFTRKLTLLIYVILHSVTCRLGCFKWTQYCIIPLFLHSTLVSDDVWRNIRLLYCVAFQLPQFLSFLQLTNMFHNKIMSYTLITDDSWVDVQKFDSTECILPAKLAPKLTDEHTWLQPRRVRIQLH